MEFEPKTREQAEEESKFPVWAAGIYDFEVTKAVEKVSKKGNQMIEVTLKVFNDEGKEQLVFDYLMAAFPLKLIDACECMGLSTEYNNGCLQPYQLEGKTGKLRLNIRPKTTDKASGKEYPEKNDVHGYVIGEVSTRPSSTEGHPAFEDTPNYDEVPFG